MPHPAVHHAFLAWVDENRDRFLIAIEPARASNRALEFAFGGINRVITGRLTPDEVNAYAIYEDD